MLDISGMISSYITFQSLLKCKSPPARCRGYSDRYDQIFFWVSLGDLVIAEGLVYAKGFWDTKQGKFEPTRLKMTQAEFFCKFAILHSEEGNVHGIFSTDFKTPFGNFPPDDICILARHDLTLEKQAYRHIFSLAPNAAKLVPRFPRKLLFDGSKLGNEQSQSDDKVLLTPELIKPLLAEAFVNRIVEEGIDLIFYALFDEMVEGEIARRIKAEAKKMRKEKLLEAERLAAKEELLEAERIAAKEKLLEAEMMLQASKLLRQSKKLSRIALAHAASIKREKKEIREMILEVSKRRAKIRQDEKALKETVAACLSMEDRSREIRAEVLYKRLAKAKYPGKLKYVVYGFDKKSCRKTLSFH